MNKFSKKSIIRIDKQISGWLCVYIFFCLSLILFGSHLVSERYKSNLKDVRLAFLSAIEKEKQQDITITIFRYDSRFSPNAISGEEKKNWCEQMFLIEEDPNRHHLECIFQAELNKLKIRGTGAIRCTVGGKTTINRSDEFYEKATVLEPVSYRLELDNNQKITLRPYVYFSNHRLASCGFLYTFAVIWLFVTILFIYFSLRKNHMQSRLAISSDTRQVVKKIYEPPVKNEWIYLRGDVCWDEKRGILKQGDKVVLLSGDSLTYFRCFIRNENFMLTYYDILKSVYKINTDEISKSDRSRISHGIERLQKQLESIENIQIILVRGKGYRMEITITPT